MDNTIEKVLLAGRGALKTTSSSVRKSCGGENARIPMLVGKRERHAMKFPVSSGQTPDALDGLSVIEEEERSDVQSFLTNGRGV